MTRATMAAIELSDLDAAPPVQATSSTIDPADLDTGSPPQASSAIDLSDLNEPQTPVDHGKRYTRSQAPDAPELIKLGGRAVGRAGELAGEAIVNPKDTAIGVAKGAVNAVTGMAEWSVQTAAVLGDLITGKHPFGGTGPNEQEVIDRTAKIHKGLEAITHINMVPEGQDQEAFSNLLSTLPEAFDAVGDDVYSLTGSAALAGLSKGVAVLLSLKPGKAAKTVEPLREAVVNDKPEGPAAVHQTGAFDELAAMDPQAGHELADHIEKADPEFGTKLHERVTEVAAKPPEEVGKDIAKETLEPYIKDSPPSPEGKGFTVALTPEQVGEPLSEAVASGYTGMSAAPAEGPFEKYQGEWKKASKFLNEGDFLTEDDVTATYQKMDEEGKLNGPKKPEKHEWFGNTYVGKKDVASNISEVDGEFHASFIPLGDDIEPGNSLHEVFETKKEAKDWVEGKLDEWPDKQVTKKKASGPSLEQQPFDQDFEDLKYKASHPEEEWTTEDQKLYDSLHGADKAAIDKLIGKNSGDGPIATDKIDTKKQAEGVPSRGRRDIAYNAMGDLIAPTRQGRRAFQRWFGNSAIKDEHGRPLVYVHGSHTADIKVFNLGMGEAIFTTPDARVPVSIGRGSVMYPLYVRAEKPFDFSRPTDRIELEKQFRKNGMDDYKISDTMAEIERGSWSAIEDDRTIKAIKQLGYDGFYTQEAGAKNLAVFDPHQLKSATKNMGRYDRYDADIYASQAEHIAHKNGVQDEYVAAHYSKPMQEMWKSLQSIRDSIRVASTHSVLDAMIKGAPKDSYIRGMMEHLRTRVPDLDIRVVSEIKDAKGQPMEAGGMYTHRTKNAPPSIEIRLLGRPGPWQFQILAHEMIHAATADFILRNPDHPLVTQLHELQRDAWDQLEQLSKEAKEKGINLHGDLGEARKMSDATGTMYGVSNILELAAEVKTNSHFNQLLALSSKFNKAYEAIKGTVNKLADKMADILGFRKNQRGIIRELMDVTDKIMDAQAMMHTVDAIKEMRERRQYAAPAEDPVKSAVSRAFTYAVNNRAAALTRGKLGEYFEQIIRLVNPEALGPAAKDAAAVLAHNMAEQMQKDTWNSTRSAERRTFWNKNPEAAKEFIGKYEKGEKFSDPLIEKAATAYKNWNTRIALEDAVQGFEYEPVDNYLYHTFEDGDKVAAHFERKYGTQWGDPKFIKQRVFDFYEEAIAQGFKPRYTNPEDIMLARQHASDVATMKVQTFHDLEEWGLAVKAEKGVDAPYPATKWRSPTGESYWVHNDAHAVLHNAWETKSLWTMKGIHGDAFRGAMWLKNAIVPIKLGFSLFHPLHVATIDNATAMVRATKSMMGGHTNPAAWVAKMVGATVYKDFFSNPKMGSRILNAYKGKIDATKLTATDKIAMQYMAEGGLIPTLSDQFRNNAIKKFKDAWQTGSKTAVLKAPFAAMEWVQGLMFDKWIPSLKIASYIRDVKTHLENNPQLIHDQQARLVAFRKLSKSVDNRYGEMAYNTLFWNRMVKDLAVANTLSLGWQMGFLREYGGGALDLGQFVKGKGSIPQKIASGKMDRPMFVMYYTTQALAYGGLMTYAFTGKGPQSIWDYIFPMEKEGARLSTMFYTREFGSIYKHVQIEGLGEGMKDLVESKASGVIGLINEMATGVNSWGEETRDPNGTVVQKVTQTLKAVLTDVTPISVTSAKKQDNGKLGTALSVAGFTQAPKYVTDTPAEAFIKHTYQKYSAARMTPYERVEQSADTQKLRTLYKGNSDAEYTALADQMRDKYGIKTVRKIQKSLRKGSDPMVSMFERLTWEQQQQALDKMTPDERGRFIKHSNREHLRRKYQAPEADAGD